MKTNRNLKLDHNQAEDIFNNLSDANEEITQAWDMPKITIRRGKDVRCERIELPYQVAPVYVCYLVNIGIDDNGEIKKIA